MTQRQKTLATSDVAALTDALLGLFGGDEEALWEAVQSAAEEAGVADLLPNENEEEVDHV